MRTAYLLILLTLAITIAHAQTYTPQDLGCYSSYINDGTKTSPFLFETITIPKYAKKITISAYPKYDFAGQQEPSFQLKNCAPSYTACSTIQSYNSNCPTLPGAVYGWGETDITNLLAPNTQYKLSVIKATSFAGSKADIVGVTLKIESYFLFNVSDGFEYLSDKTLRKKLVNVYSGSGNCNVTLDTNSDFNANTLATFNQSGQVIANYNATNKIIDFNCSEGNYTISTDLPALQKTITYSQDDSNQSSLSIQFVKANAQITNPSINTTYPQVALNFSLPIQFTNTSGNLNANFDLNASETKTLNASLQTSQGISTVEFNPIIRMINANSFHLSKTFQLTNNLPINFTNLNISELNSRLQNLTSKNWTCSLPQAIDLNQVQNITAECDKEKAITFNIGQITIQNASIDAVYAQAQVSIQNLEDQTIDADLNALFSYNYSRNVISSTNVTLSPFENKNVNIEITGKFLNSETTTDSSGSRSSKTLRVWNETGFNILNATGSLTAPVEWSAVKLEVYVNDHYIDITPNTTCSNYSSFSLSNGIWKTCKNESTYFFVIPHFSTVLLKISGDTPQNSPTPPTNNGGGGGGGGGGASAISSSAPSIASSTNATNIAKITAVQKQNNIDLQTPNEINEGDFTKITITRNGAKVNGEVIKLTRPDGSIKTQVAKNGEVEFFADAQGEWTAEYNGVKKSFTVSTANNDNSAATLNVAKTPSTASGFEIALPQINPLSILLLFLAGIAYIVIKNYNQSVQFTRNASGTKVTLTVFNKTNKTINDVTLTDVLGEGNRIIKESQTHSEFKEMVFGDVYKWRKDSLGAKQTWQVTYETTKTPTSKKCEVTASGVNNSSIVIRAK